MRPGTARLVLLLAALWPAVALSQSAPADVADRVRLRDGGFVRGLVLELAPGDHVTVRLATGEVRRYAWSEVADVASADGAAPPASPPAASAAAAPSASASAAPSASASAAPSPRPAGAGHVTLHLVADTPAAWLEGRERWERAPWRRLCPAPCDAPLDAASLELRVAGDGIRPSNPIRIEGERGTVRLVASTGSERAHRVGLDLVLVGGPLAAVGTGLYGVATTTDAGRGFAITGLVALAVGGLATLAGLPLLASGSTRVRDDHGVVIGARAAEPRL